MYITLLKVISFFSYLYIFSFPKHAQRILLYKYYLVVSKQKICFILFTNTYSITFTILYCTSSHMNSRPIIIKFIYAYKILKSLLVNSLFLRMIIFKTSSTWNILFIRHQLISYIGRNLFCILGNKLHYILVTR